MNTGKAPDLHHGENSKLLLKDETHQVMGQALDARLEWERLVL